MSKERVPGRKPIAAPPQSDSPRLEDALLRLETIAAQLEAGSLPLEEALALYREARALHAVCVERLGEAERELQVLMANGELRAEGAHGDGEAGAEG
jgi:exodeoxyribonuclease VII small subunit